MKTFITIVPGENGLSIQYNDLPSHRIPASRIKELASEADSDLWRNQPARAAELGRELFYVLDGTGGRLRADMEKAGYFLSLSLILSIILITFDSERALNRPALERQRKSRSVLKSLL